MTIYKNCYIGWTMFIYVSSMDMRGANFLICISRSRSHTESDNYKVHAVLFEMSKPTNQ